MATDKSSKRGSLWAKTAGDRGWKVPRLPRGTICSGLRAAWDHISALVFPHLFSKNTTCLNEEYNCRWSRMSTRVTNAHLRAAAGSREPFLSIFQKPRWGGGDSEWSISGKGWSAHQTSEMTTASQTDESAQSLWKERERDVHIHPSILVSGTARHPAVPPKPDAWHNHPTCTHTHSLVFTLERQIGDSHTFMHSNIHTHFHSHTHYHGRGELATSCWHFHRH